MLNHGSFYKQVILSAVTSQAIDAGRYYRESIRGCKLDRDCLLSEYARKLCLESILRLTYLVSYN
jgi:hypothetical protein